MRALVRAWAPLVWLAPGEKFLPLGVSEFLDNVKAGDDYLRTRVDIGEYEYDEKKISEALNDDEANCRRETLGEIFLRYRTSCKNCDKINILNLLIKN